MNRPKQYAIDAAKEITIAAMSSTENAAPWMCAENVAEFFEAVYNKILEIAEDVHKTEG